MPEYSLKEVADLLGVTPMTVRRYNKRLGIEGRLLYRSEGGTKRVFDEVDVERLKAVIPPTEGPVTPALPVRAEPDSGITGGVTGGLTGGLTGGEVRAVLEALTRALQEVAQEVERGRVEVCQLRTELADRDQAHAQEVARLRSEVVQFQHEGQVLAQRLAEEAAQREATLRGTLGRIEESVSRPWWKRFWKR